MPPAFGQTTNTQCHVQTERAGRNNLDVFRCDNITEAHDRTLAELLLDLSQRCG